MMAIFLFVLAVFFGFMTWLLLTEVDVKRYDVGAIMFSILFCFTLLASFEVKSNANIKEMICAAHPQIEQCEKDKE